MAAIFFNAEINKIALIFLSLSWLFVILFRSEVVEIGLITAVTISKFMKPAFSIYIHWIQNDIIYFQVVGEISHLYPWQLPASSASKPSPERAQNKVTPLNIMTKNFTHQTYQTRHHKGSGWQHFLPQLQRFQARILHRPVDAVCKNCFQFL